MKFFDQIIENFFVAPVKGETFKCPRCQQKRYYESVDGFIQHSNSLGASWKGEDITNKRCVDCNVVMDRYVNSSYLKFISRWKTVGTVAAFPFILWGFIKFLDYLLA